MNTQKNHEISLATAIEMTTLFRAHKPEGFAQSETFDKAAVLKLLSTEVCASLRIYYGMKADRKAHAILVAVDEAGNDLLPAGKTGIQNTGDDDEPVILEDAWRCPPLCPVDSPLNG